MTASNVSPSFCPMKRATRSVAPVAGGIDLLRGLPQPRWRSTAAISGSGCRPPKLSASSDTCMAPVPTAAAIESGNAQLRTVYSPAARRSSIAIVRSAAIARRAVDGRRAVGGPMAMGGPIVLDMYSRAPQLFRGMVLIDTIAAAPTAAPGAPPAGP